MIFEVHQFDVVLNPFWQGALVFFRVGAIVSVAPVIGERVIPARVRLGIAVLLTMVLAPLTDLTELPEQAIGLFLLAGAEVVTGLAIGLALRTFLLVLHMAGSIAAQTTSLSQLMGNPSVDPVPALAQVLVVAGLALAAVFDLHLDILRLLALSYQTIPLGVWPDPRLLLAMSVGNLSQAVSLAFSCAAPFVIGSLVYNLALGVINRAMPQLMVAFVGAPAITLGSMALLAVVASGILVSWWMTLPQFILVPAAQ